MLRIENLSVEVNGQPILNDVSLHIKPGEVHVLFGPNGTGKSTLIGTIMGFARYTITAGKICAIPKLPETESNATSVG